LPLRSQWANLLLHDPLALSRLHFDVWCAPQAHPQWRVLTASAPAGQVRLDDPVAGD
jgi:hypothetical protein